MILKRTLNMLLDLDLDLGVHLDLDKKTYIPIGVLVFVDRNFEKALGFVSIFHSNVVIWLEVCISSGHFTRSF